MKNFTNIFVVFLLLALTACNRRVNKAHNLVERGIMYAEAEQYAKAIELYNRAIEVYPKAGEAYLQLALLYDENLGDKAKAIVAYNNYLKVAGNETNKKKVEEWIREAEEELSGGKIVNPARVAEPQDKREENVGFRNKQIEALKRQISEKYEKKIDELKNEIFDVENQCAKLSNENIALRANDTNKQIAHLLDTIASNELAIATLQTQIEAKNREANASVQAQETLQTIITNLQAKISVWSARAPEAQNISNDFLISANEKMKEKIEEIKSEKNDALLQLAELKIKYAQLTSAPPAAVTNQPTVPLTPELLQEFENAKKQIVEYRRRENFNKQERKNFIETIKKLREQLSASNERLVAAQNNLKNNSANNEEIKQLREDLKKLNASIQYREKQLYDRTLQLKKLQQSYQTLSKQYNAEVRKRQKINTVITDIQKEIGTPARKAPPQPKRKYTVKAGDSLMKISQKTYGDKSRWREIYRANKEMLDAEKKLKVGQVLIIP